MDPFFRGEKTHHKMWEMGTGHDTADSGLTQREKWIFPSLTEN